MRFRDIERAAQLKSQLDSFSSSIHPLPGLASPDHEQALIGQLLESIRRVKYVEVMRGRDIDGRRALPSSNLFDPLKAAVLCHRNHRSDEAFWLVFLSVHFGKPRRSGWRLARDIYGALGGAQGWDWARTSANPAAFREWLAAHQTRLRNDGIPRGFGNHRKYESLDGLSPNGTGAVIESYISWVRRHGTHEGMVAAAATECENDPRRMFHHLFQSMGAVRRFGRTARFDYLTMVGKLGLAVIEPGSAFLDGATGPWRGGILLFENSAHATMTRAELDAFLVLLGDSCGVNMQVVEDALCNWQKSPTVFRPFRG